MRPIHWRDYAPARSISTARPNRAHGARSNAAGNLVLAAPFAAVGYGTFIERTNFHVREVDMPFPVSPPVCDGLRILQLSDIHLSAFLSEAGSGARCRRLAWNIARTLP